MASRSRILERLDGGSFDVLVVGGGINGAVAAAVLAARGASVALVERGDFAGFTSQASSNLVWGGFKYLENYEVRLVRKLCVSRNRLLHAYPTNITEVDFVAALDRSAPHPPWLAALGATAYWAIGSFQTRSPRYLTRRRIEQIEPVIDTGNVRGGIRYADAYLNDNDSRFVFGFVRRALDLGAAAANYVELVAAERSGGLWHATVRDVEGPDAGDELTLTARCLVNAAGPFVDQLGRQWGIRTAHRIVYSKGIHLVVPQLTPSRRVLAFYDDTGRLFYVIPMGNRSVIGTTDTRVDDPYTVVTDDDRAFLLGQINARLDLDRPLTSGDVIAERTGVRPLVVASDGDSHDDVEWTSLSRKHEIELDAESSVVTIFGGKLTDCLNVGEEVAEAVGDHLGVRLEPDRGDWYGEPGDDSRHEFYRQARMLRLDSLRDKPGVEPLTKRLWRRYGWRALPMLEAIRDDPSMGLDVMESADYLRVELHHAADHEMVTRLDDFMQRRSKIDLVVRDDEIRAGTGLGDVARILFGDRADAKLAEYLAGAPS